MGIDQKESFTQLLVNGDWFKRNALLFPVIVIASYYIGRGLGDSLQLLYLISGLAALKSIDLRPHRKVICFALILWGVFLLAVFNPDFSLRSLKYWILYALSGMVLVFTVGLPVSYLKRSNFYYIGMVPVALLIGLIIEVSYFFFVVKEFHPAVQINGMILASLAPLIFLFRRDERAPSAVHIVTFYASTFIILVLADSRTELVMLLLGGLLMLAFFYKKITAFLVVTPLIFVFFTTVGYLLRYDSIVLGDQLFRLLNVLSSRRLEIWAEAFSSPPDNVFIGAGIKRSMELLPQLDFVKHLHNIFIEIWYETGALGLLAYTSLLFVLLSGIPRSYRLLEGFERKVFAVFLASGFAVMIAGLLDEGYLHPLIRYYMLFCFTVVYLLSSKVGLSGKLKKRCES